MTTPLQEALERIAREAAEKMLAHVSIAEDFDAIKAALREYGALVAEMACKAVCTVCQTKAAGLPVPGYSHTQACVTIRRALPEPQR